LPAAANVLRRAGRPLTGRRALLGRPRGRRLALAALMR
jgi:hypothetical protein